eukprot:423230-Pleurochrysis_carterae.AAC.1
MDTKSDRRADKRGGDDARSADATSAGDREHQAGGVADKAGAGGKQALPPISLKIGSREKGAGAVDTLQALIAEADPDAHRREYPCAWALLFGSCAKGPSACPSCEREASGAKAKPLPKGALARGAGDGASRAPAAPAHADLKTKGTPADPDPPADGRAVSTQPQRPLPPPEPPPGPGAAPGAAASPAGTATPAHACAGIGQAHKTAGGCAGGGTPAAPVPAGTDTALSERGRQTGGSVSATPPAGHSDDLAAAGSGRDDGAPAVWRALIAFSGDGRAQSTLEAELRARGADVDAVDVAVGGRDHDLARPEVANRVLEWVRSGRYHAVFAATPCASFSVAHVPQLRTRSEPEGANPVPRRWTRYLAKHNTLARFTADLVMAADGAGA